MEEIDFLAEFEKEAQKTFEDLHEKLSTQSLSTQTEASLASSEEENHDSKKQETRQFEHAHSARAPPVKKFKLEGFEPSPSFKSTVQSHGTFPSRPSSQGNRVVQRALPKGLRVAKFGMGYAERIEGATNPIRSSFVTASTLANGAVTTTSRAVLSGFVENNTTSAGASPSWNGKVQFNDSSVHSQNVGDFISSDGSLRAGGGGANATEGRRAVDPLKLPLEVKGFVSEVLYKNESEGTEKSEVFSDDWEASFGGKLSRFFSGAALIKVGGKVVYGRWPLVDAFVKMNIKAREGRRNFRMGMEPSLDSFEVAYEKVVLDYIPLSRMIEAGLNKRNNDIVVLDARIDGTVDSKRAALLVREAAGREPLTGESVRDYTDRLLKAIKDLIPGCRPELVTRYFDLEACYVAHSLYGTLRMFSSANRNELRMIEALAKDIDAPWFLCMKDSVCARGLQKAPGKLTHQRLATWLGPTRRIDVKVLECLQTYDDFTNSCKRGGHSYQGLKNTRLIHRALRELTSDRIRALVRWRDLLFPFRSYAYSRGACDILCRLLYNRGPLDLSNVVDERLVMDCVGVMLAEEEGINGIARLHEIQKASVEAMMRKRVMAVTGPGGTGKSKAFIRAVKYAWDMAELSRTPTAENPHRNRVLVVAPTGIAAKNVKLACGKGDTIDSVLVRLKRLSKQSWKNTCEVVWEEEEREEIASERDPRDAEMGIASGKEDDIARVITPQQGDPSHTEQYEGDFEAYFAGIKCLVIEEASRCDEKKLYYILSCLKGLEQVVFVFDNRQTAPYGRGFPSYDIEAFLQEEFQDHIFRYDRIYRHTSPQAGGGIGGLRSSSEAVWDRRVRDFGCQKWHIERGNPIPGPVSVVESRGNAKNTAASLYVLMQGTYGQDAVQAIAYTNETKDAVNEAVFHTLKAEVLEAQGHGDPNSVPFGAIVVGLKYMFTKNYYGETGPPKPNSAASSSEGSSASARKKTSVVDYEPWKRERYGMVKAVLEKKRDEEGARSVIAKACISTARAKLGEVDPMITRDESHDVRNGEIWQIGAIEVVKPEGYYDHDEAKRAKRRKEPIDEPRFFMSTSDIPPKLRKYVVIYNSKGDKWVYLRDVPLRSITPAYCTTIDKYQSSQSDNVIGVIEDGQVPMTFTLNHLVTMAGRPRVRMIYVASDGQLEKIISQHPQVRRNGGLYPLLKEESTKRKDQPL